MPDAAASVLLPPPTPADYAAVHAHARRRAWQRLGLVMSDGELAQLAAACLARQPVAVTPGRRERPVYRLRWRGRLAWVVLDLRLSAVVTILPGPPWSQVRRARRDGQGCGK